MHNLQCLKHWPVFDLLGLSCKKANLPKLGTEDNIAFFFFLLKTSSSFQASFKNNESIVGRTLHTGMEVFFKDF